MKCQIWKLSPFSNIFGEFVGGNRVIVVKYIEGIEWSGFHINWVTMWKLWWFPLWPRIFQLTHPTCTKWHKRGKYSGRRTLSFLQGHNAMHKCVDRQDKPIEEHLNWTNCQRAWPLSCFRIIFVILVLSRKFWTNTISFLYLFCK